MKKVLVVVNKLLFGGCLESLLSHEDDIRVRSVGYTSGESLAEEIQHYEPHVVLVDESIKCSRPPTLFDVLVGFPNIRVLVVNTQENMIQVFDKQEICVKQSLDFISAVKN